MFILQMPPMDPLIKFYIISWFITMYPIIHVYLQLSESHLRGKLELQYQVCSLCTRDRFLTCLSLIPPLGSYSWCILWTQTVQYLISSRYTDLVPTYHGTYIILWEHMQLLVGFLGILFLMALCMKTLSRRLWISDPTS